MRPHNHTNWIQTFLGEPVDPLNPEADRFHVEDIAHALSNQCRFSGHTKQFYSVAQHSVLVSLLLEEWGCSLAVQLYGLFHDASEAYLVDMPTPIKRLMPAYREAEAPLQAAIEKALLPELGEGDAKVAAVMVKKADLVMLATEARDLMGNPKDWKVLEGIERRQQEVCSWSPNKAKRWFLDRYAHLNYRMKGNK